MKALTKSGSRPHEQQQPTGTQVGTKYALDVKMIDGAIIISDAFGQQVTVTDVGGKMSLKAWVTSEINKLERIQGSFDASPGLLPVAGDKIYGDLTQIVAGDYWIISVAGTIAGIGGEDVLDIGDKLQYVGGGAATAANWVGIQTNLNDANIGNVKAEKQTVALVAGTPLAVNAATIANIHSVQVYNSAGALIVVDIEKLGGNNQRTLTSKKSLTGVVVELTGTGA